MYSLLRMSATKSKRLQDRSHCQIFLKLTLTDDAVAALRRSPPRNGKNAPVDVQRTEEQTARAPAFQSNDVALRRRPCAQLSWSSLRKVAAEFSGATWIASIAENQQRAQPLQAGGRLKVLDHIEFALEIGLSENRFVCLHLDHTLCRASVNFSLHSLADYLSLSQPARSPAQRICILCLQWRFFDAMMRLR